MSRRRRRQRTASSGDEDLGDDEAQPEEADVHAIAVRRVGPGHETVELRLPASVVERYAVRREPPEIRAIVAGRLSIWVEAVP